LAQGPGGGRDAGQQLAVPLLYGAEQTTVWDAVRSSDIAACTVHRAGAVAAGRATADGNSRLRLPPPTVAASAGRRLPIDGGPPAPPSPPTAPTAATAAAPTAATPTAAATTGALSPIAGRILPVCRVGLADSGSLDDGGCDDGCGDDDRGGRKTAQAGTRTCRLFHTFTRADTATEDRRRRPLDGIRLDAVTAIDGWRRRLRRRMCHSHGGRALVVTAFGHVAGPFPGSGQSGHGSRRPDDGNVESQSTVVGLLFRDWRPAKGARRGHARQWQRRRGQLLWTTDAPHARQRRIVPRVVGRTAATPQPSPPSPPEWL